MTMNFTLQMLETSWNDKLFNLPQELLFHKNKEDQAHEDQLHCPRTVLKIQVKFEKD